MTATVLKRPPQSQDLNPNRAFWDVVAQEIHIMDIRPINLQQMCDAIMSLWNDSSNKN